MSQPNQQKIYAPISAKKITFASTGNTILKLGINVEKFKAWLDQHKNEKGYVNLGISARRETSQYGETHSVWLDTWSPQQKASNPAPKQQAEPAQGKQGNDENRDDVPF